MRFSQFLSDWGIQGMVETVLKSRSQFEMKLEVLMKDSYTRREFVKESSKKPRRQVSNTLSKGK